MYNLYNPEANFFNPLLESFRNFLYAEKIAPGSVRSYVSDVRYFLVWLDEFLRKSLGFTQIPSGLTQMGHGQSIRENQLGISENLSALLGRVNQKLLEAFKESELAKNTPLKTINRRFSSLRKFGSFCQSQQWITNNYFDTLRNISQPQEFPENTCHLGEFKNYLWKNKASKATIKNYLNDVKQFLAWQEKSEIRISKFETNSNNKNSKF